MNVLEAAQSEREQQRARADASDRLVKHFRRALVHIADCEGDDVEDEDRLADHLQATAQLALETDPT